MTPPPSSPLPGRTTRVRCWAITTTPRTTRVTIPSGIRSIFLPPNTTRTRHNLSGLLWASSSQCQRSNLREFTRRSSTPPTRSSGACSRRVRQTLGLLEPRRLQRPKIVLALQSTRVRRTVPPHPWKLSRQLFRRPSNQKFTGTAVTRHCRTVLRSRLRRLSLYSRKPSASLRLQPRVHHRRSVS